MHDKLRAFTAAASLGGVLLLLVLLAPAVSHAFERQLITWDELAPSTAPYDDPFLEMPYQQKSDLRDVLRAREAQVAGVENPALQDAAAAALQRLDAAGLDADALLEQRLVVMERRREEATGVTASVLDREVVLDGYALPLAQKDGRVVEFLLVPWVGACIHTPPPPPNQIVHVSYPEGLTLDGRFDAVRLSGVLRHDPANHDLFLIDGSREIPTSYALHRAEIAGTPGEIVAASAADVSPFVRAQIWINTRFVSGMTAIGEAGSAMAMIWAILLAFGYGALHTLGPGHGKAVVVSYFVGTGGSLRRGLTMGTCIAVFHVLSAVLVVFLFDFAVRQSTGAAPSDYRAIRLGSYALIVLIGAVMLWQALSALRASRSAPTVRAHDHDHSDHSHHHDGHFHAGCAACNAASASKGGGWLAAAVGIVPCTGALIVMLFGMANDLVGPAILMVAAISAGMAVTMSAIGIAALWGRGWAQRRFGSNHQRRAHFEVGARLVGSAFVLVIGLLLLAVTFIHGSASTLSDDRIAQQTLHDTETGG